MQMSAVYGIIGIEYYKIPLNGGYVTDPMSYSVGQVEINSMKL